MIPPTTYILIIVIVYTVLYMLQYYVGGLEGYISYYGLFPYIYPPYPYLYPGIGFYAADGTLVYY